MKIRNRKHLHWLLAAGVLLLLLLLAGTVLIFGSTNSAHYDDTDAILNSYNENNFSGLTLREDGSAVLRLRQTDVVWLSEKYGFPFDESSRSVFSGPAVTDTGFRLQNGKLSLFVRRKLLGVLPVAYRGEYSSEYENGTFVLQAERVMFGSAFALKEKRWPAIFREPVALDLDSYEELGTVRSVYIEDNAFVLETDGLIGLIDSPLQLDSTLLENLRRVDCAEQDRLGILAVLLERECMEISPEEAAELMETGGFSAALTELLACCPETEREDVFAAVSPFLRRYAGENLLRAAAERSEELYHFADSRLNRYEKLLMAVRETYKAGTLRITALGFQNTETRAFVSLSELSGSLSVTDNDGRILFLTDERDSGGICTANMPALGSVPIKDHTIIHGMDREQIYDLGIVLSTNGGIPVLLHYSSEGVFCMDPIDSDTYVDIIVHGANQVWDISTLLAEE